MEAGCHVQICSVRLKGCLTRRSLWNWLLSVNFFYQEISKWPFPPAAIRIWWPHWFLFLLDEFSNRFRGERRWHFFTSLLLCQLLFAGTILCIQIKLHMMVFCPFANWWVGKPHAYETLACYLWPVSRLWTGEILKTKSPLAPVSKLNTETTVPPAGILREMQMMLRRSTRVTNRSKMQIQG